MSRHAHQIALAGAVLLFALAHCAHAQTISINPVAAVKALHSKTPASTRWRRLTMATALGFNGADWGLTRYNVGTRGLCESNPIFQQANGCDLNAPKFDGVKFGISVSLASEEGVHQFMLYRQRHAATAEDLAAWKRRDRMAERLGTFINVPTTAVFGVITVHNIKIVR